MAVVIRLRTDRGLPALPKLFRDVQFAGHGHEVSRAFELHCIILQTYYCIDAEISDDM